MREEGAGRHDFRGGEGDHLRHLVAYDLFPESRWTGFCSRLHESFFQFWPTKPQLNRHAIRAIRVGQIVRTSSNAIDMQKGSQRRPLLDSISSSGPVIVLPIVPHLLTDAANRDPRCRFHHTHVLSSAVEQCHSIFPLCGRFGFRKEL